MKMLRSGLIAGLLLASCRIATGGDSEVAFTPEVSTPILRIGDTVGVTVRVRNERAEPITLEGNHCNQHFEVRDAGGRSVGPAEAIACLGISIPVVLDPGESHTFQGFWSGRLTGSGTSEGIAEYARAGTYHIRGRASLVSEAQQVTGGHLPIDVR